MKFYIWTNGDPTVGLPGDQTEVEVAVDSYDGEDRKIFINECRDILQKAFAEIWDSKVFVRTEEEVEVELD